MYYCILQITLTNWSWYTTLLVLKVSRLVMVVRLWRPFLLPLLVSQALRLLSCPQDRPSYQCYNHFNYGGYAIVSLFNKEGPAFPSRRGSPKWTCLKWDASLGSMTPLMWIPSIIPSRLTRTLEEFNVVVWAEDLSFVQKLYEEKKMDIFSKVIFNMYQASSLFSLDIVGWGDFFCYC